jgi:hypothetical protein
MSDNPKIPIPTQVKEWPPEVQQALFEMVAFTWNEKSDQLMFSLQGLHADGKRIGDWEVTVRRIS